MPAALENPIVREPAPQSTTEGSASRVVFSWTAPAVDLPGARERGLSDVEERLLNIFEARLSEMSEGEQCRVVAEISAIEATDRTRGK